MRREWEEVTLGEIADLQTGPFGSQLKAEEYVQNGIPVVMPINIDLSGTISINKIAHTTEEKASLLKKYKLKNGDIVFSRRGDLSKIGYITNDQSGWLCGTGCLRARPKENIVSCFLHLYLKQKNVANWLEDNSIGQTMKNINTDILSKLPIILPSYEEQKKIAERLSIWDSAIEKTEKLISEKEKLYKGHLNYFYVENENCIKLSEFAKEISRRNKNKEVTQVLSVTNKNGFVLPEQQFGKKIASEDLSNYKIVEKGQFAYNPSRINVGSIARLDDFDSAVLSPMYTVFEINTNLINSDYFLHWLLSKYAIHQIKLCAQGGVREIVGFEDLKKMKIKSVSLKKQEKIAFFLNLQKSEISLLKKQLEQYKLQKQGLMQKLLTGEWRVK